MLKSGLNGNLASESYRGPIVAIGWTMTAMLADTVQTNEPPRVTRLRPTVGRLAWVFARFGNTVFGGGTPTVMVLEGQIVDHDWLDRRWTHLVFALSRLTPGTNLLAFCTGVGPARA